MLLRYPTQLPSLPDDLAERPARSCVFAHSKCARVAEGLVGAIDSPARVVGDDGRQHALCHTGLVDQGGVKLLQIQQGVVA